jgi:hypothetical protein
MTWNMKNCRVLAFIRSSISSEACSQVFLTCHTHLVGDLRAGTCRSHSEDRDSRWRYRICRHKEPYRNYGRCRARTRTRRVTGDPPPNDQGRRVAANSSRDPAACRAIAGAAGTDVRMMGSTATDNEQGRCALMKAKQRVPVPRGGQLMAAVAHGIRRGRTVSPRTPKTRTTALAGPRIRGMSG